MAVDDNDFVVLDDDDVGDYNTQGLLPESPETVQKIREWLQPTDFGADSSEYNKHLISYVAGTGNWIQETETYQAWHDSPDSASVWIKAIPGAGKSVFAAMMTDKLAQTEKVPVLYFFFRQIIAKNHDPQYLVRDWLCQLLFHSPSLQSELKRHMEDGQSLDGISIDEFWQILLCAMELIPKLYCVADALDEMDISKLSFLNRLVELGNQKRSTIKVLMTSRPLPRIESILRTPSILQISILQIRLQQDMVDTDIAVYVDHRLREQANMRLSKETQVDIRSAICTKGQGSFLYARLMMDSLLETSTTSVDLEQLMKKLPVSLEDMYNEILLDHATRSGVPQELQLTILQWVTHSLRPLRLLELATMIDSLTGVQGKSNDTKAVVRKACGPLLEILEDETVSIIHHSFTEFLLDRGRQERVPTAAGVVQFPVIESTDTQRLLSLVCLSYLTSGSLDHGKPPGSARPNLDNINDMKMAYPFLDYAASSAFSHVSRIGSVDEVVFAALDDFMMEENQTFDTWVAWKISPTFGPKKSALHVAAHHGVLLYCQHLLQLGQDVNMRDINDRTPISWAAARGHADTVAILLENGANADDEDRAGLRPLHYAAKANHFEVVRHLLAACVDPLTPRNMDKRSRNHHFPNNDFGVTALQYACRGGCVETVIELMKCIDTQELNRGLGWAINARKSNVVIALLKSPTISVDDPIYGQTPLCFASRRHDLVVMKALLEKGADPNAKPKVSRRGPTARPRGTPSMTDSREETPLHALAGGYRYNSVSTSKLDDEDELRKCCKLLIDTGGDVNAVGNDGEYPMHNSTSPAITSTLLEHGAQATVASANGSTPLHFVCENGGHEELIDLLIRHGADINARRHIDGKTPLHTFFKRPNLSLLEKILANNPDVNAKDGDGNTPLHLAVWRSSAENSCLVRVLLDAGADPNQRNLNMQCPIHMVQKGEFSEAPILLNAGADLESQDDLGRTVLMRCLRKPKIVKQLLDLGANIETRDIYGNSVLHLLCENQGRFSIELLRLLVEAGANVSWTNNEGNTVLHKASKPVREVFADQVGFLETLLQLGSPTKPKNCSGATPLHIACSSRPSSGYMNVWKAIIDLLLGQKFNIGIDEGDNNGIRAIHSAATLSEQLVLWLVDAGADPAVCTLEGQTPLQVACRARQANIVGGLLEIYQKCGQSHIIDWQDKRGRTALHDACRSGRPETIKLLLEAGADPKKKDKRGYTPLHVCAEFVEENVIWSSCRVLKGNSKTNNAANVLIEDFHRPIGEAPHRPHPIPFSMLDEDIQCEHDTVRIREPVRLLLAHGADLDATSDPNCTPLYIALCAGSDVMVDELLSVVERAAAEHQMILAMESYDAFVRQYLRLRSQHTPLLIQHMVKEGDESFSWNKLLRLDDEKLFEELIKKRVDFLNEKTKNEAFPVTLVKWGYATLLERFGREIAMYHEPSRVQGVVMSSRMRFEPLLHIACSRELPNMDVIGILVEKMGVDVNARATLAGGSPSGRTALHVLASGQYWWQTRGTEYLLLQGADTEIQNEEGESPLLACANNNKYPPGCWRNAVAAVLLRHGANPNCVDKKGSTCLNKASSNIGMTRNLIKYGANVNFGDTPALFTAIANFDPAILEVILDSGGTVGSRLNASGQTHGIPNNEIPPLLYACSRARHVRAGREGDRLSTVRLLLQKGADPFEVIHGQTTVVHGIFANGGFLSPFLELPGLDLERRDAQGMTFLLAGCSSPYPSSSHTDNTGQTVDHEPIVASVLCKMGADITARDFKGRNILHCLLGACQRESKIYEKAFADFIEDAPFLVHRKDDDGKSPLHYALEMQRIWSIELLLSAGSDPIEPDPDGNTALHFLARESHSNCENFNTKRFLLFQKFVALGISINAKNKFGETPLFVYVASTPVENSFHWAKAIREDVGIFQDAGADLFARNNNMETLLHIAAKKTSPKFNTHGGELMEKALNNFKCLVELGCDPFLEDINQRTALDVAAAYGNVEILDMFKRD